MNSITDIKVITDYNYPIIYLEYKLDEDVQLNNLVTFMKEAWRNENEMQLVFRKLYNSNYEQLNKQEFKLFSRAANLRAELIGKEYIANYNSKEKRICKSMISVVNRVSNRTLQFCFVDIRLTEISFNNFFLDRYQERFPEAHKLAQKKIASIPFDSEDRKVTQNAVLADEEMSSDDERPV